MVRSSERPARSLQHQLGRLSFRVFEAFKGALVERVWGNNGGVRVLE
jgi:hypothetical protein